MNNFILPINNYFCCISIHENFYDRYGFLYSYNNSLQKMWLNCSNKNNKEAVYIYYYLMKYSEKVKKSVYEILNDHSVELYINCFNDKHYFKKVSKKIEEFQGKIIAIKVDNNIIEIEKIIELHG